VITEAELIEALRAATECQDVDGFTSLDFAASLNISQGHAQELIRRLARAGKVIHVGLRSGTRTDGYPCRRPVYRLA
jgi:Mn-dependent DtxR family transcriptional regulator